MWIKFGNTLVNLDLIKEIHPVEKVILHVWGGDRNKPLSRVYGHRHPRDVQERQIREYIERLVEENHFAGFGWSFYIEYLNGEMKEITGTCEKEIHDARDEFYLLVSDNQSDLPHIEVEEQITEGDRYRDEVQWDGEIGDF